MKAKKIQILNLAARMGLFTLILCLGTMAALMMGETEGLALVDLSSASVRAVASTTHGDVSYAALIGGRRPAGIYRSDDNGHTWQLVSSGPVAIKSLAGHRFTPPLGEAEIGLHFRGKKRVHLLSRQPAMPWGEPQGWKEPQGCKGAIYRTGG